MYKFKIAICIIFCFLFVIPLACYANSAQPPSIIFVINNPPKDLVLELDTVGARIDYEFGEAYCAFYYPGRISNEEHNLRVILKDREFTIGFQPPAKYQQIYTLDIKNETIVEGKLPFYTFCRGAVRLLITLAIEGIIFWCWGARKKFSWIFFFVINILTQILLGAGLNGSTPFDSYNFSLPFFEIIVFAIEMLSFRIFVREQSPGSRIGYAFFANMISLILGSIILHIVTFCLL